MSDFERYEDENQGELFGAEELIRLDPEEIALASATVEKVAKKAIGTLVDQVMDIGFDVVDASAKKQDLATQIREIGASEDMSYEDVIQEMDEFYQITADLTQVAVRAVLRQMLYDLPFAMEPEEFADMVRDIK